MEKGQTELKQNRKDTLNNANYNRELKEDNISEQKLMESEEKFSKAFHSIPTLMAITRIEDGYFIDVNNTYTQVLGYSREELIGHSSLELDLWVNPEQRIEFKNKLEEFKKVNAFDVEVRTKSGKILTMLFSGDIIYLNNEPHLITTAINITDRIKVEQKLIESEEKFRKILEAIPDTFYFFSADSTVLECKNYDPKTEIFFKPEFLGKKVQEFLPVEMAKIVAENITKTIDTQVPQTAEFTAQIDNDFFTAEGRFLYLSQDRVGLFLRTITEKKKLEIKLRKSEEKYRELVNDANSIILKWDIDGKISFINEFGELFFGYSKSQLVGKQVIGTIVPKTETTGRDLEKLMKEICQNPEKYKNNINENITRYGRKVWLSWTNKAIIDDQGNLTGILSVGNDMTDRRRAAQEIKESEEKFRTITEQNFIGIAILQNFKFKYINQQFSDTIGYSPIELVRWKPKELFKIIHPEDRERVIIFAENKNYNENEVPVELQFRILRKTGEIIWLEIISKTITYKGKKADLISTLDITGKKEAERVVLEENRKLIELNKMRKDIITRVSHELKTPLTSIYGASQLLLKHLNIKIDDEALNLIKIFHRGALRLKKLVENLTDASRIEYGKLELNIKMFDLVTIIKECIDEMSYLKDNRKLILKSELPNKLLVSVDKIRLQQVITNILSNAIKNTPMNGNINISLVHNLKHIDIQIRDSGVGLTEKEKELLFEKFGKIERYGMDLGVDIEGSGLGLFIAKEIVELHGGQILVESEGRNKGALFTIRLIRKY